MRVGDEVGLDLRIAVIGRFRPRRLGEYHKAAGMGLLQFRDRLAQALAVAAGEIHHGPQVLAVHYRQAIRRIHAEADTAVAPAAGDMRMEVDDRKPRARHMCLGHVQHALRLILFERQPAVSRLGTRRLRRGRLRHAGFCRQCRRAERQPISPIHSHFPLKPSPEFYPTPRILVSTGPAGWRSSRFPGR